MTRRLASTALALAMTTTAIAADRFFAAIMDRGPAWVEGEAVNAQPGFAEHLQNMASLEASGTLVAGGPFDGFDSGMMLLRAASLEAAKTLMSRDGFISRGVLELDLREWDPRMGVVDLDAAMKLNAPAPETMKSLRHETVIRVPASEVWAAFTTAEGARALGVAKAAVDLRVGGSVRTSYDPNSTLDDDSTIVNTIIAYAPERMLAMRNTKAPADFPLGPALQKTWSVTTFEPIGPDATRVAITGYGWGDDALSQQAYNYFKQGNQIVLDMLKATLEGAGTETALTPAQTLDRLGMLVGGEWIAEQPTPDGGVFRVLGVTRHAPDGRSLVSRGWLGTGDGMWEHGATQVWLDPTLHEVRFQSIDEGGGVASGAIVGVSNELLRWDWNLRRPDGTTTRYRVDMTITGADSYTFDLYAPGEDGDWSKVQTTENMRVDTAPEAFRTMRNGRQSMTNTPAEQWTNGAVRVLAHRGTGAARWSSFEVTLPESRDAAWTRLTTVDGLQTFFAPKSIVELRAGGRWEQLFFPENEPGQRGAEGVYIRALTAPRSLEVQWNAPPQFPEVRTIGFRAHFELEALDHATTRVTLRLDEFQDGEQWDGTFDYFLEAYPIVLNRMRRAVIDGPLDWETERARASSR